MTTIAFLDVEASALDDGYPIEIGVALADESLELGPAMSWLIRPAEDWSIRSWDPMAEDLHGVERDDLDRDGLSPWTVAERLAMALAGATALYSDAPDRDGGWLELLYDQSPLPCLATRLREFNGLIRAELGGLSRDRAMVILREARLVAERAYPTVHRALPDALRLREMWLHVARAARGGAGG